MKRLGNIYFLMIKGLLVVAFSFYACKKRKEFKLEDGQASVDVRNAQAEEGIALMDVNKAIAEQWQLRGNRTRAISGLLSDSCSLTIDTSSIAQGIIRLNYNGNSCNGRKREGKITLTIQNFPSYKLKDEGCAVKVDFSAYKITNEARGNTLQFDGTAYLTNESGGSWFELIYLNQSSLTEAFSATDIQVTFNGSDVIYSISREITYTYTDSLITCKEFGTGTQQSNSNVDSWGYTTDKHEFTSYITTPIMWTSSCGPTYPVSGELTIQETDVPYALKSTYGLDASGIVASQNKGCLYGFKTNWTYKGKTKHRIFAY